MNHWWQYIVSRHVRYLRVRQQQSANITYCIYRAFVIKLNQRYTIVRARPVVDKPERSSCDHSLPFFLYSYVHCVFKNVSSLFVNGTDKSQSFKSFVTSRGTARGRRPLRRAPSRIITDYRLSEKRSISADEIYLMICAAGDHSDMSEKRVL